MPDLNNDNGNYERKQNKFSRFIQKRFQLSHLGNFKSDRKTLLEQLKKLAKKKENIDIKLDKAYDIDCNTMKNHIGVYAKVKSFKKLWELWEEIVGEDEP